MANSFICLIVSSIIITIIVLLFKEQILYLFGADSITIEPAKKYISFYIIGTLFIQLTVGINAYINTQGFTQIGMKTTLLGAILNIILDPIFIYLLDMGITGAAIATVIAQSASCVWVLKFLTSGKSTVKLRKSYFRPDFKIIGSICALGISTFIMSSTESLLQISFNNRLSIYGGTTAVGVMSIMNTLLQCISLPTQGIMVGAQPVLSYNYGAKNMPRLRQAFKYGTIIGIVLTGISIVLFWTFPEQILKIFNASDEMMTFGVPALKIMCTSYVFAAAGTMTASFMQSTRRVGFSLIINILRQLILLLPLMWILSQVIGMEGIWWSFLAAETITVFISIYLYRRYPVKFSDNPV